MLRFAALCDREANERPAAELFGFEKSVLRLWCGGAVGPVLHGARLPVVEGEPWRSAWSPVGADPGWAG